MAALKSMPMALRYRHQKYHKIATDKMTNSPGDNTATNNNPSKTASELENGQLDNSLFISDNHSENVLPPEGINVSNEHPLKEFSGMIVAGIGIAAILVISLSAAANWFAPKIPFHYEVSLAARITEQFPDTFPTDNFPADSDSDSSSKQPDAKQLTNKSATTKKHSENIEIAKLKMREKRQKYLENLTQKYLQVQPIDDEITISVHYIDNKNVNAFATIGGHIFIHSGLFNILDSENALAFVLGHEIGHIADRHPISSLGRGLVIMTSLSAMLGISDAALPDWLISQTTNITLLTFSREQEADADLFAIEGVYKLYGHIDGADALFQYLKDQQNDDTTLEILTTHPLHDSRLEAIAYYTQRMQLQDQSLNGSLAHTAQKALTPIPAELLTATNDNPDQHSEKP